MANVIENQISVTTNEGRDERRAYNGMKVKSGEVLAPMMITDDLAELYEVEQRDIRTWHTGGKGYKVVFYPVPEEVKKMALQQFYSELNEFLGERRDARCLIPQDDGSLKKCPKKRGDNRQACADCPHNGEYQRENKSTVSLDYLKDNLEYEPEYDDVDLDIVLLKMTYNDLLQQLEALNPRYARIVSLGMDIGSDGINLGTGDKKELVDAVMHDFGLKKSRAYQEVNATEKIVKEILSE